MKNIRARTRPKTHLTSLSEYPSQIPGRSVSSLHGFQILGMGVEGWDGGGWLVSKKRQSLSFVPGASLVPWLPGDSLELLGQWYRGVLIQQGCHSHLPKGDGNRNLARALP